MAYSDSRGLPRLNAVSVGGAFLINGLMLAGFVMLKPDVVSKDIWTVIEAFEVDPPEKIEPKPQPIEQAAAKGRVTVPDTPAPPLEHTDNDFVYSDPGPTNFGRDPGPIVEPDPIKIEPVFKNARFDPRYAGALQPSYPPGMIRNRIEGAVTVKVLIGPDGRVKDVQAIRADQDEFLAATRRQALAKWRFLPATRDGVAIESWREMTVKFIMPKDF